MIILGIDPGLNFTGWGVLEDLGREIRFIDCGIISPSNKLEMSERLHRIYEGINNVIEIYKPKEVSVEETFVNSNPLGALKLGYARGVVLMVPSIHDLRVYEYAPNTVKKTVAGNGHATKDQVRAMLKLIMPNMKDLKDDAIDALSIALCHAYHKNRRGI